MPKTVTLVTNQYQCDRIITAARRIADETGTELLVSGVLDSKYELNPQAIEYLFNLSKQNGATMRLVFAEDKISLLCDLVGQSDHHYVVTGMPSSNQSVLYDLWKKFPNKSFYAVEPSGELTEVAGPKFCTA